MNDKIYKWIIRKNPHANDWNGESEHIAVKRRVKEEKPKCVVLFDGKQYPREFCFDSEAECLEAIKERRHRKNEER